MSNGARWIGAPLRFSVTELEPDEQLPCDTLGDNGSPLLEELQEGIAELSTGQVPRYRMRSKLADMMDAAKLAEQEHRELTLQVERLSPRRIRRYH